MDLHRQIVELSRKHPRYGYRRITAMRERAGEMVNPKRTQRVRPQEGVGVSKKQRKMKRLIKSAGLRQQAQHPHQVWSWDFVYDQTQNGSSLRLITLIDEYTRQCLAIQVGWSIRAVDVLSVVEAAMKRYGVLEHIRSDNGPEFIAYVIEDWLKQQGIKSIYIKPGSPGRTGTLKASPTNCVRVPEPGDLRIALRSKSSGRIMENGIQPTGTAQFTGVSNPR